MPVLHHGRGRSAPAAVALVVLAAVPGAAGAQPAPERVRASVSLASDYVLHGLAQTADSLSARLAIDFEHPSGFFAGGSLANVEYDIEARFATPRDSQLYAYAGYVWRRTQWMANATLSRYHYPGIERNYDYSELAVSASFRERYFVSAARLSDVLAVYDDAYYYRAGVAVPWRWGLAFEVNAGRFNADGNSMESYSDWDIGWSRPVGRFAIDLRFHDNSSGQSSLLGNADQDLWVASLTYVFVPGNRGGN